MCTLDSTTKLPPTSGSLFFYVPVGLIVAVDRWDWLRKQAEGRVCVKHSRSVSVLVALCPLAICRFGYALWATLYMLCLVVPITGLSLRFSAVTLMGESRVWIAWGSMLHALLILLLVLTLVSSYYEERKKRILFWNLKVTQAYKQGASSSTVSELTGCTS